MLTITEIIILLKTLVGTRKGVKSDAFEMIINHLEQQDSARFHLESNLRGAHMDNEDLEDKVHDLREDLRVERKQSKRLEEALILLLEENLEGGRWNQHGLLTDEMALAHRSRIKAVFLVKNRLGGVGHLADAKQRVDNYLASRKEVN